MTLFAATTFLECLKVYEFVHLFGLILSNVSPFVFSCDIKFFNCLYLKKNWHGFNSLNFAYLLPSMLRFSS